MPDAPEFNAIGPIGEALLRHARGTSQQLSALLHDVESHAVIDGTRVTFHCHCLKFDGNGRPRVQDLVSAISDHLLDFAVPRSAIAKAADEYEKNGATAPLMKLRNEAAGLFTDLEQSGEGGDMRRRLLDHAHDPAAGMDMTGADAAAVDSEFERLVMKDLKMKGFRVIPQWKVGGYRIDLVVEGVKERLAVECDGDRFHTLENLQADMERQAVLERLGWRFIRVRGSEYFRKPEQALQPLYERLEALGIEPLGEGLDINESDLSKRVIADAKAIRDDWELEPEVPDEILNRTRFSPVDTQVEEIIESADVDSAQVLFN